MIGCNCPTCKSNNLKNKRLRTSILIKSRHSKNILIDTTPDLRTQMLSHHINKIDFVIIGHTHADHCHGIDDLRPFCFSNGENPLPVYCSKQHAKEMITRFPYIFEPDKRPILGGGIPLLDMHQIDIKQNTVIEKNIDGEIFKFFLLPHNYTHTMCFIHDSFVYIPDCHSIPAPILKKIKEHKPELLVINCLQTKKHDTHLTVDRCFSYIKKIQPKRAGLIHMNHHLSHQKLHHLAKVNFDFSVFPVYDGQSLKYS